MPTLTVTVTNTGTVTIRSIVVHPVGVYSVPSSTCSSLQPGRSCTAVIQFCPSSAGQYQNTLVVTGANALSAAIVRATAALSGSAT